MSWAERDLNKFECKEIPLYLMLNKVKPGEEDKYTQNISFTHEGRKITLAGNF